jgi:hypothetical protein
MEKATTEHGRASHGGVRRGDARSGGCCFDLRKTAIGECAAVGWKAGGHDEVCWTISDGWAERKTGRRGK